MKKLKIAQIAPLWFSIPPQKYGGTERIISSLTEGLLKKGHKVTLFASGDSKTKAHLVSITEKGLIAKKIPWHDWWWNNLNYSLAFEKWREFDVIHSHWTPLGMYFQRFVKIPILHTFHNLPPKKDIRWEIFKCYKNSNVVFLSKKEGKNSLVSFKREWIVYNGIDISQFKFQANPKNYFLWVGRIEKKKGIENAVLAAKKMGVRLLLVGRLDPAQEVYFSEIIKPHLSEKIRYLGEFSQKQLFNIYRNAQALLYPIEWEEPFGLVVAEAMACGTPVIAFNRGSMPELIKDGKTGFVIPSLDKDKKTNIEGLTRAMGKISQIKRINCRNWMEEKFTAEKMVDNYEKIYYNLLQNR